MANEATTTAAAAAAEIPWAPVLDRPDFAGMDLAKRALARAALNLLPGRMGLTFRVAEFVKGMGVAVATGPNSNRSDGIEWGYLPSSQRTYSDGKYLEVFGAPTGPCVLMVRRPLTNADGTPVRKTSERTGHEYTAIGAEFYRVTDGKLALMTPAEVTALLGQTPGASRSNWTPPATVY